MKYKTFFQSVLGNHKPVKPCKYSKDLQYLNYIVFVTFKSISSLLFTESFNKMTKLDRSPQSKFVCFILFFDKVLQQNTLNCVE